MLTCRPQGHPQPPCCVAWARARDLESTSVAKSMCRVRHRPSAVLPQHALYTMFAERSRLQISYPEEAAGGTRSRGRGGEPRPSRPI